MSLIIIIILRLLSLNLQLYHLEVRGLLEVDHRFRKEGLDQLVRIVLRLSKGVHRIYIMDQYTDIFLLTIPVEDDVTCALVSQFKLGVSTLRAVSLTDAAEHQESLLGLLKIGIVLTNESRCRVLGSSLFNLYTD